ncbi:MAG TPA: ATP-dependent helicase, partial [Candidatus Methanoperedenaceae archaeon]|nr:ATP-dependent helicase [Candidatus Methanoperedenaceae archaeon]
PKKLVQTYYDVGNEQKFSLLVHLLKHEKSRLVMVFCNTKRNTDRVARNLNLTGIAAEAIHGGLTQGKRNSVMQMFHSGKSCVVVCTDVAARGLDIRGVSHVYNYDIPRESKQYVHRVGRTARAGAEGKAINILSSQDYENFSNVLKNNEFEIAEDTVPAMQMVSIRKPERRIGTPLSRRQKNRYRRR